MTVEAAPTPPAAPTAKLFSPLAITVHTLLFTPLVGGTLAALNWRRLGDAKRFRNTMLLAWGGTAVLCVISALWPERWGNAIQGGITGATVAMAIGFRRELKATWAEHLARGGQKASFWFATLAGMAMLGLFVGAMVLSTVTQPGAAEFQAGQAALQQNQDGAAERDFLQALSLDPSNDAARYNLALAVARQGRLQDSLAQLAKISKDSEMSDLARALEQKLAGTIPDPGEK